MTITIRIFTADNWELILLRPGPLADESSPRRAVYCINIILNDRLWDFSNKLTHFLSILCFNSRLHRTQWFAILKYLFDCSSFQWRSTVLCYAIVWKEVIECKFDIILQIYHKCVKSKMLNNSWSIDIHFNKSCCIFAGLQGKSRQK